MKCQFQILPRVNGGIATADSSFLETGSMVNSFLKTKDVIVISTTTTKRTNDMNDTKALPKIVSVEEHIFEDETFTVSVWDDGTALAIATFTATGEIVFSRKSTWSTPEFAAQWGTGVGVMRYSC